MTDISTTGGHAATPGSHRAPPSALLALTELPRAAIEFAALQLAAGPLLLGAPKGDGHPVLVLPGFVTSDTSTTVLRRFLKQLGYKTYGWELGRNLGPRAIGREGERLIARLQAIHDETGEKVSLVGWSLGGIMARQVARRLPHAVRQVITLGSPITGDPRASNVWKLYEKLAGQKIDSAEVRSQMSESQLPPPVPSTAIYSRGDGVVAWQNCLEPEAPETENVEVHGSHCGLGVNPAVLGIIADRLALAEGGWAKFEAKGVRSWFYPGKPAVH